MSAFEYEREDYQQYLENLTKEGTYQEYENAIFEMNTLKNKLRDEGFDVHALIDQVDNIYYGDILFHMPKQITELGLYFRAGQIIGTLSRMNAITSEDNSCIYFNKAMNGFMYTAVAIQADDGPDLYAQNTRKFIVR